MKRIVFVSLALMIFLMVASACTRTTTSTSVPANTQPTSNLPTAVKIEATQAKVEPTQAKVQPTTAPATAATQAPAANGTTDAKALFEEKCSTCHGLNRTTREKNSADGWKQVVDDMISRGADITPAQETAIVNYLAATYK